MRARIVAWSAWALTVLLGAGATGLSIATRVSGVEAGSVPALEALAGVTIVTVGALVASRRPRNAVGWILLAFGLPNVVTAFAEAYAVYGLFTAPGAVSGPAIAAWVSAWAYIPGLLAAPALLFLLFPDGRLLSPRWRTVVVLVVAATASATIDAALGPVLDDAPFVGLPSPLPFSVPGPVLVVISGFGWPGMVAGLVLGAVAMVQRLRRSHGVEREQLTWMASAAALLPVLIVVGVATYYIGRDEIGALLVYLGVFPIPLTAAYAVLRHRLYDIRIILNRALVYGSVTALLGGTYVVLVLLLQSALGPLTRDNSLAVAISTLAVAALFRPARRYVQALVDRRFFRAKYDAGRTLERFAARLRTETDLDVLRKELASVVSETLQPAHVSVWLRGYS